jgi:hypothetical protein
VKAPVLAPVKAPVLAPVKAPVLAPVKAPVLAPVKAPVLPPVKAPVLPPVKAPVLPPVKAPVGVPAPAPVGVPVPSSVRINEFHYSNVGDDAGEFVEIFSPKLKPVGNYSVWLYDGKSGTTYNKSVRLSTVTPNLVGGKNYYKVVFALPIRNGVAGIALVDGNNRVVSFLSYEGKFVATNGPANGIQSVDVGVSEGEVPVGFSLQLCPDTGVWSRAKDDTPGAPNLNCTV